MVLFDGDVTPALRTATGCSRRLAAAAKPLLQLGRYVWQGLVVDAGHVLPTLGYIDMKYRLGGVCAAPCHVFVCRGILVAGWTTASTSADLYTFHVHAAHAHRHSPVAVSMSCWHENTKHIRGRMLLKSDVFVTSVWVLTSGEGMQHSCM